MPTPCKTASYGGRANCAPDEKVIGSELRSAAGTTSRPSPAAGQFSRPRERSLQAGDQARSCTARKYSNTPHTTARNHDRQHMDLAGKAAGHPVLHVVRDRRGCTRCLPDRSANHRQPRSLTDKSQRGSLALMQVAAQVVAAFQAGHEGSIPFARSGRAVPAKRGSIRQARSGAQAGRRWPPGRAAGRCLEASRPIRF
jgi:hypothetical protein